MMMEKSTAQAQLQVKLALAGPPVPTKRGPDPEHYVMLREVQAMLGQR